MLHWIILHARYALIRLSKFIFRIFDWFLVSGISLLLLANGSMKSFLVHPTLLNSSIWINTTATTACTVMTSLWPQMARTLITLSKKLADSGTLSHHINNWLLTSTIRTIPRTVGVSTTDLVGRMLLMTREHHSPYTSDRNANTFSSNASILELSEASAIIFRSYSVVFTDHDVTGQEQAIAVHRFVQVHAYY